MWIRPSNEFERRAQRVKTHKELRHFPSAQTGASFSVQTWRAEGVKPERQLLFLHGALSHGGRHSSMFEWLIRYFGGRLEIHALDFVGHGISSGARAHIEKFSFWVEDLIHLLTDLSKEQELSVMGHSMGGLVALKAMLEHEARIPANVKALILSNPCIRPVQVVDFPKVENLLNGIADKLPTFRFPRVHKGPMLVNDAEAANAFETDPLIPNFITAQMTREIWYASQEVRSLSYFLKRPTLFLVSDQDQVVDRDATLLFARGIDKHWLKVIEYNNVKHELLHETIRQQVWQDVASWLENT